MGSSGLDGSFTEISYLCGEPLKTSRPMLIFTHIAAAIVFYAVLRNNPKIEKIVDAVFTVVERRLKALFAKILGHDD